MSITVTSGCRLAGGILAVLFALAGLTGCESEPRVDDSTLVFVTREEVNKLIASEKRPAMMVDARNPSKFVAGHIAGAINLPLTEAEARDPRLAGVRTVIVYAEGYTDPLAIALSKKLLRLRYEDVRTYRDGLKDWIAANGATAQGDGTGEADVAARSAAKSGEK